MGNIQTQENDERNIISSRKKDCEKFNACGKDKLYTELTTNFSPRRKSNSKSNSKSSKKSKRKSSKKSKSNSKSNSKSSKKSYSLFI
jgi:hypothetical protein